MKSIAPLLLALSATAAAAATCPVRSPPTVNPVLELFTSEGCSSCPPADRYVSGLRARAEATGAVVQAFHVGYWDSLGWVDRFATPAHTARQRQVAAWNGLRSIYTPQLVLNGADWQPGGLLGLGRSDPLAPGRAPATMDITLAPTGPDQWEAQVTAAAGAPPRWSAYWTVTEHSHVSRVNAGENRGETLGHDFVVRQYVPVGDHGAEPGKPQRLSFRSLAATPDHARQINLVVFDPATGRTLQAVAARCPS